MRQTEGHVKRILGFGEKTSTKPLRRSMSRWKDNIKMAKQPKLLGLLDPKEESITLLRNKDKQEMTGQMM